MSTANLPFLNAADYPGGTVATQIANALTDLGAGSGVIIVPADMGAGALPSLAGKAAIILDFRTAGTFIMAGSPMILNMAAGGGGSQIIAGVNGFVINNSGNTRNNFAVSDAGDATFFGQANLGAGTATVAPLKFVSGTNLTTAAAGALEFDGKVFYASPIASNRGVSTLVHFTSCTADFTGTNVNTAQPVFNTTEDVITLPALTSYLMEGIYHIHTTGTTSHTFGILFGGTATFTSFDYAASTTNAATEVLGAEQTLWCTAATAQVLTVATATATHHTVRIEGIVRVNGAGTLIPQYIWSAAPGVAGVTLRNSYLSLTPIGSNTIAAVGNWA